MMVATLSGLGQEAQGYGYGYGSLSQQFLDYASAHGFKPGQLPSNYMIDDAGNVGCQTPSGQLLTASGRDLSALENLINACPPVYQAICTQGPSAPCPPSQPNCAQTLGGGQQPATGNPATCPAGWTLTPGSGSATTASTNPLTGNVTIGTASIPVWVLLAGGAVALLLLTQGGI